MNDSGWRRPSPSLVISFISLLVAMSGTAVAVKRNAVGSKELKRGAVKSRHVDKGAIRGKELKRDGIKGRHVKAGKLKSKHLKDGQGVSGADVIDGSLGRDDFGPDSVGSANVVDDSLTGDDIDEASLAGLGSPTGPAGGDLSGNYPDPDIAAGAVGTGELDDLAVTTAKIAQNAIGSGQVADDSLTGDDIDESRLDTVPDADQLDGLDSSQLVQGGGRRVSGPVLTLVEGAGDQSYEETDEGRLTIGCTNVDGATINYTNLQGGIFNQNVWIDRGALGGPTFSQISPAAGTGLSTGPGTIAHIVIRVTGAGVVHDYDIFARHDDSLDRCRFALSRRYA